MWSSLKACQASLDVDRKHRFAAAEIERQIESERLKRQEEIRREIKEDRERRLQEEKAEKEEDLLSGFFTEITSPAVKGDTNEAKVDVPEGEDDMLAGFFNEISTKPEAPETASVSKPSADPTSSEQESKQENILTEKYTNQDLGDGRSQV